MTEQELKKLEKLLAKFRDIATDREESAKRESVRFDVEFEIDSM